MWTFYDKHWKLFIDVFILFSAKLFLFCNFSCAITSKWLQNFRNLLGLSFTKCPDQTHASLTFHSTDFKFTNFWLSFSHFVGFPFFIATLYDANPWFSWLPLLHNQRVYPNLCQAVHCSCFTFFSIKVSSILKYYTDYREAEKKGNINNNGCRDGRAERILV